VTEHDPDGETSYCRNFTILQLTAFQEKQMKSDRLVIAAVLFLAGGLALLFGFTRGSTGLSVGYPFSATSLHVDMTTTGIPALIGVPLLGAGALLLFVALIAAIVSQFRRPERILDTDTDLSAKRREPFGEFED